jgi:hypothetical protein
MFETIPAKDDVVAIRLGETLTKEEIDRLYADVQAKFGVHEKLSYYCDATAFQHLAPDAVLEGLRQRMMHLGWLSRFDRVAVVTDSAAIRTWIAVMDALTPVMQVKAFQPADAAAGLAWVQATD